jgi:hypothetical protein
MYTRWADPNYTPKPGDSTIFTIKHRGGLHLIRQTTNIPKGCMSWQARY